LIPVGRYYQHTGTASTLSGVPEKPDREAIKRLTLQMKERAGTRKRLTELAGVESTSTPQGWEKHGRVPRGPQVAALVQLYPDLATDLVRAIAPGVEPLPISVEERAAANLPANPPGYARLVRAARIAKGWSQAKLEEEAGLTGKHEPDARHMLKLVAALEIPPETMAAALDADNPEAALAAVEGYIMLLAAETVGASTTGSGESARHREQGERRSATRRADDSPPQA